jgi:hypothetical protein
METRGESREKAETEQGNNKETRRICSLISAAESNESNALKKGKPEESET